MAFYAQNFVFDNIPSETFSLIISSSDGGEGTSNGVNDVEIKTQQIFRRPKPFFYGVQQGTLLEFEVEIMTTETELTAIDSSLIQKWLFGQTSYKKLRIVQPDMEDIYFNCFFKSPQIKRVGNIIRGFTATVVCDSPFAWGNPKSVTYTQSNVTYTLFNESENMFYTYPYMTWVVNSGGSLEITNQSDNNRVFSMTGLLTGETVTVDNDLQIITGTLSPNVLSKLTSPYNFFRLVNGKNTLYIRGYFSSLTITYTPMKRMG